MMARLVFLPEITDATESTPLKRTDDGTEIRLQHLARLLNLERWLMEIEQTCAAESLRWLIERERARS